ncbi:hypothetical protein WX45_03670 [Clostridium ljungdahlii DSM 13528]|uniref:Phytanoyl-CoA dioxygenase n=1 Tax=Clostridium ljungdahlii (strain ATCC 55383 / DSM 13528 / PETC) TaxID=748727 RepID=D8GPZ3_CLOLD|nr:hypothetical protein [Clostridium ljungdahlii]ADK16084.1 hypothetical protein CLJU_c30360 [Clostridium ljungdahlii DSM 13528]OAA87040.1 hypothetical protein WX45_03670 [Clostridium ljungdahlii DSM 13528]
MKDYKEELKRITGLLLKKEDNYGEIKKAADDLYHLFVTVSGLEEDDKACREDYYLPKGKAIGTVWAGMCIKEFMRTKKFVRGVFLGMKCAKEKFPNRKINILYAGTGPFATLMLPLTTIFSSSEVGFTLLEINLRSVENLKKVIKTFKVEEYVEKIVQCDAAEYKVDRDKPIHMIVTETMQRALQKEPQVAITLNLVPQMEPDGILIPENVVIQAGLLDTKRDMDRMMGVEGADKDYCYHLNEIFQLNKSTARMEMQGKYFFEEVEVEIPSDADKRYKNLNLFTNIQVFEEERLSYLQCSLTLPLKIMNIGNGDNVKKVNFQYVINEIPGFRHKLIN